MEKNSTWTANLTLTYFQLYPTNAFSNMTALTSNTGFSIWYSLYPDETYMMDLVPWFYLIKNWTTVSLIDVTDEYNDIIDMNYFYNTYYL